MIIFAFILSVLQVQACTNWDEWSKEHKEPGDFNIEGKTPTLDEPTEPFCAQPGEQVQWQNEGVADWQYCFDQVGWCKVPKPFLMIGLFRSGNSPKINDLDKAPYAESGESYLSATGECKTVNWRYTLDYRNNWALCDNKYALAGLYRDDQGEQLSNIDKAMCCTGVTEHCYVEENPRFELDGAGFSYCAEGHALAGIYRGEGDRNQLSDIEKFRCCRMPGTPVPYTPTTKVMSYWTTDGRTFQRKLYTDDQITIQLTQTTGTGQTASQSEHNAFAQAVAETNSVEVAVEGTADFPGGSATMSAKYGYVNTQTHSQEFQSTVGNIAQQTFNQEIKTTLQFTATKRTPDEPIFINYWTFRTDAIQKIGSQYQMLTQSLSDLDLGIEMTGCGYDIAPNCLPGHCMDANCWKCTDPKWKIDLDFEVPTYSKDWPDCIRANADPCCASGFQDEGGNCMGSCPGECAIRTTADGCHVCSCPETSQVESFSIIDFDYSTTLKYGFAFIGFVSSGYFLLHQTRSTCNKAYKPVQDAEVDEV